MIAPEREETKPAPKSGREREQHEARIGDQVLEAVGRPPDLLRVQVRRLWDDRYRVNLFVGPDVASARVAFSFYLVTDGDGRIVASTPRMSKSIPLTTDRS